MTRSMAFRAFLLFTLLTVLSAFIGISSQVPMAEVLFLISGSLCGAMLFFTLVTPVHALVPVRVRRNRR